MSFQYFKHAASLLARAFLCRLRSTIERFIFILHQIILGINTGGKWLNINLSAWMNPIGIYFISQASCNCNSIEAALPNCKKRQTETEKHTATLSLNKLTWSFLFCYVFLISWASVVPRMWLFVRGGAVYIYFLIVLPNGGPGVGIVSLSKWSVEMVECVVSTHGRGDILMEPK